MRVSKGNQHLRVKAIAGTHVVLIALDLDKEERHGLHGFAIAARFCREATRYSDGLPSCRSNSTV